jgi:hypothetical protein
LYRVESIGCYTYLELLANVDSNVLQSGHQVWSLASCCVDAVEGTCEGHEEFCLGLLVIALAAACTRCVLECGLQSLVGWQGAGHAGALGLVEVLHGYRLVK